MLLNLQKSFLPSTYRNKTVTSLLTTHLNFYMQIKGLEGSQMPKNETYKQLFEKITSISVIEVAVHEIIAMIK